MRKIRIGLIVGAIIIVIAELTFIDFINIASSKNLGPFVTLIGMILVIISQIIEIRNGKNK